MVLVMAVIIVFLLASMILSKFFSQDAFGSVLPISFILSWTEIWLMDFKVLTQETEEKNRSLMVQNASGRVTAKQPADF